MSSIKRPRIDFPLSPRNRYLIFQKSYPDPELHKQITAETEMFKKTCAELELEFELGNGNFEYPLYLLDLNTEENTMKMKLEIAEIEEHNEKEIENCRKGFSATRIQGFVWYFFF